MMHYRLMYWPLPLPVPSKSNHYKNYPSCAGLSATFHQLREGFVVLYSGVFSVQGMDGYFPLWDHFGRLSEGWNAVDRG